MKGKKKMSKISVDDINFDDVTGSNTKADPPPQPPQEQVKETKTSDTDYRLAIRLDAETIQLITLETCTPTEFFQCMSQNYPYMGSDEPDQIFKDRQSRVRTLKHVLQFHSEMFKPLQTAGQILQKKVTKPLPN
jgi:hypothetical protein